MSQNSSLQVDSKHQKILNATKKFVTIRIDGQSFAIPAMTVEDILLPHPITHIPLASPEILGLLNLRGRVVTAIDLRVKMGMDPSEHRLKHKSIVVSFNDILYSFVVDEVTGVYDIPLAEIEHTPDNLSEEWKKYCTGIYKLKNELMAILNVDGLLGEGDHSE